SVGRTLFPYHRRHRRAAGHRDGADPWDLRVRHVRQDRILLLADRAVPAVPAGAPGGELAVRPVAARDQEQSAAGIRDRGAGQPAADRDLYARGFLRRHCRCAVHPDHGAGLPRRVLVRALGRPDAGARARRHRLSLWRPDPRGRVQDAAGILLDRYAAILDVLDRPRAGRDRAGRPRAHASLGVVAAQSRDPAVRRTQGRRRRSRERRAMTIALETKGLEKSFGGLRVTRDLSLRVEQGARHALIGPNGAGKTTVINLLTGVLAPNAGRILLEGNDITGLPVHRRVLR